MGVVLCVDDAFQDRDSALRPRAHMGARRFFWEQGVSPSESLRERNRRRRRRQVVALVLLLPLLVGATVLGGSFSEVVGSSGLATDEAEASPGTQRVVGASCQIRPGPSSARRLTQALPNIEKFRPHTTARSNSPRVFTRSLALLPGLLLGCFRGGECGCA